MVLYQFDFTVVAFPFEFFFLLDLFWIDVIDLIDSTEKKSRKVLHTDTYSRYSSRGGDG